MPIFSLFYAQKFALLPFTILPHSSIQETESTIESKKLRNMKMMIKESRNHFSAFTLLFFFAYLSHNSLSAKRKKSEKKHKNKFCLWNGTISVWSAFYCFLLFAKKKVKHEKINMASKKVLLEYWLRHICCLIWTRLEVLNLPRACTWPRQSNYRNLQSLQSLGLHLGHNDRDPTPYTTLCIFKKLCICIRW